MEKIILKQVKLHCENMSRDKVVSLRKTSYTDGYMDAIEGILRLINTGEEMAQQAATLPA